MGFFGPSYTKEEKEFRSRIDNQFKIDTSQLVDNPGDLSSLVAWHKDKVADYGT